MTSTYFQALHDTPRINLSTLTNEEQVQILKSINGCDEAPWCHGVLDVKADLIKLFFEEEGGARSVSLAHADTESLSALSAAGHPATFGQNHEDVFDESYRKARVLNKDQFSIQFSPEGAGLEPIIQKALAIREGIEFELYKLNVYGQGSFFKPHQDTPRSRKMIGSLVIVFPTPHEGGALPLTHRKASAVVDFAKMLAVRPEDQASESGSQGGTDGTSSSEGHTKIAYAAFFGNVKHEVLEVISGYRVSLTYNLYYAGREDEDVDMYRSLSRAWDDFRPGTVASYESAFNSLHLSMSTLLASPSFLPKGGLLGFELAHQYAIPKSAAEYTILDAAKLKRVTYDSQSSPPKPLESLRPYLRGSDAVLWNVFADLKLAEELKFIYEKESKQIYPIMCDYGLNLSGDICYTDDNKLYELDLRVAGTPLIEKVSNEFTDYDHVVQRIRDGYFTWVRRFHPEGSRFRDPYPKLKKVSNGSSLKLAYAAYGNQGSVGYTYADVTLVVWIGPPGCREGFKVEIPDDIKEVEDRFASLCAGVAYELPT